MNDFCFLCGVKIQDPEKCDEIKVVNLISLNEQLISNKERYYKVCPICRKNWLRETELELT